MLSLIFTAILFNKNANAAETLTPIQQMELQQLNQQLIATHDTLRTLKRNIRYLEDELSYIDDKKFNRAIGASIGYSVGVTSTYWGILSLVEVKNAQEDYVVNVGLDTETSMELENAYEKLVRRAILTTAVPAVAGFLMGTFQHAGLNSTMRLDVEYRQELQLALLKRDELEQSLKVLQAKKQELTQ